MITRYGYITDDLDKLSLEDLEATLIDLDKDSYIDDWERWNLMSDYMSARWVKLQKAFEYTHENIKLLNDANELLKASAERVARKAWRMCMAERAALAERPCKSFNYVDIETHLYVPHCFETDNDGNPLVVGDVDERLWEVLVSYYRHERSGGAMMSGHLYTFDQFVKSEDDFVCEVLWSLPFEDNPKIRNWGHDCLMDMEATKDICFVWPFHSLVSHEYLALSDLIKIRGYKEAITVEYGKNDN